MKRENAAWIGAIILILGGSIFLYFSLFVWGNVTNQRVYGHIWGTFQEDEQYESYKWSTESCYDSGTGKTKTRYCTTTWHTGYRWRVVATRWVKGAVGEPISYPEVIKRGDGDVIGNVRPSRAGLVYFVQFIDDNKTVAEMTVSLADLNQYPINSKWHVVHTLLGGMNWSTLERTP